MAGSVHKGRSAGAGRPDGVGPAGAAQPVPGTAARPSPWLSLPWVAILFITGAFHLYRGVPVDAAIFLAAGVALAVDTSMRHSRITRHGRHTPHGRQHPAGEPAVRLLPRWFWPAVAAAVGALSLAVVVLAPENSTGIPAVVGLVGAAMLLVAWPDPPRTPGAAPGNPAAPGHPAPRVRRAACWWGAVVLLLCVWEMGTYFIDRFAPADTAVFPPLTDLLQPLFDGDSSRWFMTGLWLVACGALVRVGRRP
ncbi:hypothetical protein [Arthrobacter sp. STN4]|uniref:hypothetical protein n=1 Tax=Arthrobacter sp. STN4 TaxID=2923276 RepID=UPI00211A059F|nr:hypothetical protein [Arthrobacter sp. STN4]MCQ9164508.1 hypothetical protein [Arthrobacter sp. STN4]